MARQIKNLDRLIRKLEKRIEEAKKESATAVIFYTAEYAIYVHEDIHARHENGGQSKFLETPVRLMSPFLGQEIYKKMLSGQTLGGAVYQVAHMVKDASKTFVPVDTGELRASAGVRME